MSAMQNIVEGVKIQENARKQREAFFRNEEEKQAREMIEKQEQAETTGSEEDEVPEALQEQLVALQKAMKEVTEKIKIGGTK
ncbi:hypothetical protein ACFPYN_11885 [Paenisporosarcina macmurdoensis]|uniref:Uncharacterized protein n=1 Tax=Paenisporosarcina macmurdoensis TaxID=212659 RepID=A0ABW1L9J0_9BACL